MSVTPAPRTVSNPGRSLWPVTVIVIVVVIMVPTNALPATFASVGALAAVLGTANRQRKTRKC